MAHYKYKKKKNNVAKVSVLGTTAAFILLGAAFMIIGYHNKMLNWMKVYGLVFIVISAPIFLFILYRFLIDRTKDKIAGM